MKIIMRLLKFLLLAALPLVLLTACDEEGGLEAADDDAAGEAAEEDADWPSQEEVVADIDEVVERMDAGELEYDQGADSDEVIEALQEVIPQPEDFPTRAIEWVIGFGEGGGSDNFARFAGYDAERIFGQDMIYNNMPGASGEVALGHVLTQQADGYTLSGPIANQVINDALGVQPYSFVDDFDQVIRLQGPTEIYWVVEDSEWETFEDMLDHAVENPGDVTVTGSGIGGDDELRLLALEQELDTDFIYVPFDGVGDRTSGLLSGDIDVMHETAGTVFDLYEDGQIRPLAYGGDIVFEDIDPDIPSVAELGYDVPANRWRGIAVTAGVDPQVLDYLHNVFYAATQLPYYTDYEADFFQDVAGGYLNSEEFAQDAMEERETITQLAEELDYDTEAMEEELEEDEE